MNLPEKNKWAVRLPARPKWIGEEMLGHPCAEQPECMVRCNKRQEGKGRHKTRPTDVLHLFDSQFCV